jgi:mannose-6-phosphate isomerase-like protein (cupin superfamily)
MISGRAIGNCSLFLARLHSAGAVGGAGGQGASLHRHPYAEVFLVQEGKVAFVVGSETVIVNSGNVVIVPALTPHKFTNVGTTPLRMCGIHPTTEIIQHQLEE